MLEIERKFLINEIPEEIWSCEKQEILQWYFKNYKKNIRIRQTITIKKWRKFTKYYMTQKQGKWLVRQEDEKEISEKQFNDYREFAKDNQIKKTRYLLPYKKHIIEINQFHDKLDWLWMAEVEFPSIKESQKFTPPSRCFKEITEQKEANNSYLAVYGMNRLVQKNKYKSIITSFQLKSFYNKEAKKYSQTRKKHRNDANIILQEIKNKDQKKLTILEIGCWSGRFLEHLNTITEKDINYIWVDISENLIEEAKKIKIKKSITTSFVCKNMVNYLWECKQESIDIIVWIASFQHLTTKKQRFLATKYMYRCLKYDWLLIMTNRSFSLRMLKTHRKTLLKGIWNKIISPSNNERNNILIPWKNGNTIYKRFYHIFTKKELQNIIIQCGFIIKNLWYLSKEWIEVDNRKKSNNTLVIAKKSIFNH